MAQYRIGDIQSATPASPKALGILDTQWAELCALKGEKQFVKLLDRGISPQDAYQRIVGDRASPSKPPS